MFNESRSLGVERQVGGKFLLKLNICGRPIVNKYREGKMKRTLKRELKVPEIAEREANRIISVRVLVDYERETPALTARLRRTST